MRLRTHEEAPNTQKIGPLAKQNRMPDMYYGSPSRSQIFKESKYVPYSDLENLGAYLYPIKLLRGGELRAICAPFSFHGSAATVTHIVGSRLVVAIQELHRDHGPGTHCIGTAILK